VRFRTAHDLLVYLVALSDSDRASMLRTGSYVMDELVNEGAIEWKDQDFAQLARFLFALRDDGSITFTDHGEQVRGLYASPGFNDIRVASDIRVTSHGRLAV
jgi:hypothetical protein